MWRQTTLGEYYDVRDGTHDSPKYVEHGIPLLTSKNLRSGKIDLDKVKFISEHDYLEINKRSQVNVGDVLMAMIGTIGNPVEIVEEPNYAIKNVALFKTNTEQCPRFLKYFLSHPVTVKKMLSDAKGTTQKFVGLGYLRNFPISVPPLAEQHRIVAKLDAAFAEIDRAIDLTNEKLHLAEQSKESFITDIIINADNICHKRLGDACEFSQGVQVPKPEQSETLSDKYPQRFLRIIDFTSKGMEPPRYISQKGEKHHMTENDVALVRYGNPGFVCRGIEGTLANNLFKVIPRTDELDNSYLYYFLKSGLFQRAIRLKAHGVAMQAISFSLISETELQKKIANKAEAIEATLLQLERYYSEKLYLLNRLKSSLLTQELQPRHSEAA